VSRAAEAEPTRRRRPTRTLFLLGFFAFVFVLALAWVFIRAIPSFEADLATPPTTSAPTYLLIGSDSRENVGDLEGEFGSFSGQRADVIMIAQPVAGEVRLLSLPRDLKVEIPENGTNKINAAYAFGGAELLAETIRVNFDMPIHHVIEIDFSGFAELVDAAGGVAIEFPYEARDLKSGLNVPAGTDTLNGTMAVAYVRSRSYQELRDGSWVSMNADDIGRTQRQQVALKALVSSMASPAAIIRVPAVLGALDAGLKRDESLGPLNLLVSVGFAYRGQIDAATLPVGFLNEGGVSYVVEDVAEAEAAWLWIRGEADLAKDE